jgi:hypothetical protein
MPTTRGYALGYCVHSEYAFRLFVSVVFASFQKKKATGIPQILHDSHSGYLKFCERTLTFAVSRAGRRSGGALSGETPTRLNAVRCSRSRRYGANANFYGRGLYTLLVSFCALASVGFWPPTGGRPTVLLSQRGSVTRPRNKQTPLGRC